MSVDALQACFDETMDRLLPAQQPEALGVAVSGGSDSTALMFLAAHWGAARGVKIYVATVDHGLRPEASFEAAQVAGQAGQLGLPHATLRWDDWDGSGNLQAKARNARRRLLWFWGKCIDHILLGHTKDDLAETVLMNLARGSGVAGLSGIPERARLPRPEAQPRAPKIVGRGPGGDLKGCVGEIRHASVLLRPLLAIRRDELRSYLSAQGILWSEDPSNADPRFNRVKARHALAKGNALGLSVDGLAETGRRMARAREALARRAQTAAQRIVRVQHGDVLFDLDGLAALDAETRLHLVAHALRWVSSAEHRPRMRPLEDLVSEGLSGRTATLHGCVWRLERNTIRIHRELKAVSDLVVEASAGAAWDKRWRLTGPAGQHCRIRALGEDGWKLLPDLVDTEPGEHGAVLEKMPPRVSLLSAPSIWDGGDLISVPPFKGGKCMVQVRSPMGDFFRSLQLD